jgi:hypothetical protein
MSVEALTRVPQWGAREVVAAVHEALDHVPGEGPVEVGSGGPGVALGEVDRAIHRLQGLRLRVIADADERHAADDSGLTSTSAWVAARSRTSGADATADVTLAVALDNGLGATKSALGDGRLSTEHAKVIATTAARLPATLAPAERERIEVSLVAAGERLDPDRLRKAARRALAMAERSVEETDAHEGEQLQSEEERAWAKCRFTLRHNDDGTSTGHFTVPRTAADILKKVIQQVASPKRLATAEEGRGAAFGLAPTEGRKRAATVVRDIDWAQRYGQAFAEILQHLPTDRLHGKVAATIVVTVDHDKLVSGMGAAGVETGSAMSIGQVRRLACEAGLLPAVLDGESLPLDLGRTKRYFQESQRVALATTYDACAADDCDRPYAWCDLHHERPFAAGGRTDLRDAVPLCGFHHRLVHGGRHDVRYSRVGARTAVTFRRRP